jgi:calcium-dependent protein kinase
MSARAPCCRSDCSHCCCCCHHRHFGIYDDAKELLQSADTNGDGLIDYAEFSWLLRNQNENLKHSARAEAKGQLSKFF